MSFVWKPCIALNRKRLLIASAVLPLCLLTAACSDDEGDSSAGGRAKLTADSRGHDDAPATSAVLSANPSSMTSSPAADTIQTPTSPEAGSGLALSAAAPPPLSAPVIHTVD